jgi:hypothetical protein
VAGSGGGVNSVQFDGGIHQNANEDDSESSATESQNGSEGKRNKLKEARSGAAPPRHPNPSSNSIPM